MKKILATLLFLSLTLMANNVHTKTYDAPVHGVYEKLIKALSKSHIVVISEFNILGKFEAAGLPKAFGNNFNKNNITAIKAIMACNGWYGNEVANADPAMLAYCPIRITVVEKDNKTTISYVKATTAPKSSKAYPLLEELSKKIVKAIDSL